MARRCRIEAEQRWLVGFDWRLDEVALSTACQPALPAAFHWTLRDLPPDAIVSVEHRQQGDKFWQSHPAEKTGEPAYRAQLALDPRQPWEYSVVATGQSGIRATGPRPLTELEWVVAKRVQLDEGETYQSGSRHWVRYALLELGPAEQRSVCNQITAATLELVQSERLEKSVTMLQGRPPEGPPPYRVEGFGASTAKGSNRYDEALWTAWVEIPNGQSEIRARVTFGDGEEALVPASDFCCPPQRW